jgi:2'-5' RNA ligase
MVRVFVAFPIHDDIARILREVAAKNSGVPGIRWTPRANLHVTLFFIGEVEEENLTSIKQELQKLFLYEEPFQIVFDAIAKAGKPKNPSMVWARFQPSDRFRMLGERIFQVVGSFMTIKPQHADPIPHITLGRMKPGAHNALNLGIRKIPVLPEINFAALWKTEQSPGGVRYIELEKYQFGK